jgi:hypothetical protein
MKKILFTSLTAATVFAVGCGSNVPSTDQVRSDFQSPSGKTSDKQGVMAVNGQQGGAGKAISVAGSGSTFGGLGLTADGKVSALTHLQPKNLLGPLVQRIGARHFGYQVQELRSAQSGECGNAFANATGSVTDTSGSFSVTIDLSSCDPELSGTMTMDVEYEIDQAAGGLSMTIEQSLDNVCEKAGDQACVSGDMLMEMKLNFGAVSSGMQTGSADFLTAWALDATWKEGGKDLSASTKGGMRAAANNSQASVEYLFYVKDSTGAEVSYVMTAVANDDGSASISIKGGDGELTCSVMANGAGSCTGTGGEISWTDAELVALGEAGWE